MTVLESIFVCKKEKCAAYLICLTKGELSYYCRRQMKTRELGDPTPTTSGPLKRSAARTAFTLDE